MKYRVTITNTLTVESDSESQAVNAAADLLYAQMQDNRERPVYTIEEIEE